MSSMPENASLTVPMLARGRALASLNGADEARAWLNQHGAHRAARLLTKGAVGASSTFDSDVTAMTGAFTSGMANSTSVFFKLYADNKFTKMPMHERIGIMTSSPTAAIKLEGRAAPISRVVISSTQLQPVIVTSMLAATRETVLGLGAEGLFNSTLNAVIGEHVDAVFLSILLDDTDATTIPSSGNGEADAVADVRAAMLALGPVRDPSKLVALVSSDVAMMAAALGADGGGVFPGMTPAGGQLRGVNCLVSSGLPSGTLLMLDAAQIAAAATEVDVQVSSQADFEASDAPVSDSGTPTGVSMVSGFQTNTFVMRAVATIAATRLRNDALALVEGVSWGGA